MGTDVRVRRVYDESSPEDGARVLVDRVWPRGMRTVSYTHLDHHFSCGGVHSHVHSDHSDLRLHTDREGYREFQQFCYLVS